MLFIIFLKKKNLENYSWFGFYCNMNWKRSCFLWSLWAVTYHCRRELFSQTSLLVMIYNTPFYLNPGVANTSYITTTKNHLSAVYSCICDSLDHSCSLQYHFSVINRTYSKFFHCCLQNLWVAVEIIARWDSTYICALQKVWRMSATLFSVFWKWTSLLHQCTMSRDPITLSLINKQH